MCRSFRESLCVFSLFVFFFVLFFVMLFGGLMQSLQLTYSQTSISMQFVDTSYCAMDELEQRGCNRTVSRDGKTIWQV